MHLTPGELSVKISHLKKVHFIGISSPFCSFCASYLLNHGVSVTASENNIKNDNARSWIKQGILFPGGHDEKYIQSDLDLVVFPNGIIPDNPEVKKVLNTDAPYILIQELVGVLSLNYQVIAVAGSYGKTTTTAMIVWLIRELIGEPSYIVGDADDTIKGIGKNWAINDSNNFLVMEACEYKKQFVYRAPHPYISVVTHIDHDHINYYPTQDVYNQAFVEFLVPTQYAMVIDTEASNEKIVLKKYHSLTSSSCQVYPISQIRSKYGLFESKHLHGGYNQENFQRAAAVGDLLALSQSSIKQALESFLGVTSRFEFLGKTKRGMPVYLNFSHSPIKLTACIRSARELCPNGKVIIVYQPKGAAKVTMLYKSFAKGMQHADVIIIPDIITYAEIQSVNNFTPDKLVNALKEELPVVSIFATHDKPPYSKTAKKIVLFDKPNNLLVVIRATQMEKLLSRILN